MQTCDRQQSMFFRCHDAEGNPLMSLKTSFFIKAIARNDIFGGELNVALKYLKSIYKFLDNKSDINGF